MPSQIPRDNVAPTRRILQLTLAGVFAAVIAACGGGGVGAGGTGATASGTVNGFGSVIVNGVRYDDSSASVSSDDNNDDSSDDNKLRIGMQVEIETSDDCGLDAATCVARSFKHDTGLAGEISAVNLTAGVGTITVLGQSVNVGATTAIYPTSAGGVLSANQVVKVHGRRAANGDFNATYIEIKAASVAALLVDRPKFLFRLTGALNKTAGTVAGQLVNLSAVNVASIADGAVVRVRITPADDVPAQGWGVVRVQSRGDKIKNLRDRLRVEVQGLVSDVASTTDGITFSIDGVPVLVPTTARLEGVTRAGLVADVFVEVKGNINANGVLVATKIELGSDESEREFYVLAAEISNLDTSANTFVVTKRNTDPITVSYSPSAFEAPVTEDNLLSQAKLEIKGDIDAATGNLIVTRIKRED